MFKAFTIMSLVWFAVWIAAIIGWVINLVAVIHGVSGLAHLTDISGMLALRIVGIPAAPLGALLGLFF